ncbi:zf-HC2 domain-containing protein [Dactylosporangium sp. NPDC048998]|uniref:zf-HC2 domain-containing protein n=1 Tax=Dactylosporangium sp. NPDC048998 TaxID=3363976 RepID=UPI00371F9DD1
MGSNHRSGEAMTHIPDQIDLYLTGALNTEEEERFEEHLLLCAACREQADRASEIAAAVAALPADVVAELEWSGVTAPPTTADRPARPATTPRAVSATRPAARRPPGRPGSRGRRALSYAAALLVGAVLGVGGMFLYPGPDEDRVSVGSQSTTDTRGQFSVTTTARAGNADVRAVAVGLRPGEEYDLIAVGLDGRNYVAAHGVAAGGPQTIVGSIPVTRDQIRFFALTQGDLLMVTAGS